MQDVRKDGSGGEMKYVEEMALRAWNECHGTNRCHGTIEQVIADTKRASKQEIDNQIAKLDPKVVIYIAGLADAKYIIGQAEVKGNR